MLIRRLASNLIDFIFFWLIYFACFFASALPVDENNSGYFLFLSFLIVVILPVLFKNITLGKVVLGISWEDQPSLKVKLVTKYLLYFAIASPSLRLSSALDGILHLTNEKNFRVVFADGIAGLSLIFTDVIVYFLSSGKFHINDYLLKLTIKNCPYRHSSWRLLSITYLFALILLSISAFTIKANFSPDKLTSHLKSIFYEEQFPTDQFYGGYVVVTKDFTDHVFVPSEPTSFLFTRKVEQKTLFVNLPYQVFQSYDARKRICVDLVRQSTLNDIFGFVERPKQLRIILSSIKMGRFLNYYNYYRVYYFDNKLPEWGIYGGIKGDTTITKKYVTFLNQYNRERLKVIEGKMKMPIKKILAKIENDNILRSKFDDLLKLHFKFSWTTKDLSIKLDNSKIKFEKIEFSDSHLYGNAQINFPVSNIMTHINAGNIIGDRLFDIDDNVFMLIQAREITNSILK